MGRYIGRQALQLNSTISIPQTLTGLTIGQSTISSSTIAGSTIGTTSIGTSTIDNSTIDTDSLPAGSVLQKVEKLINSRVRYTGAYHYNSITQFETDITAVSSNSYMVYTISGVWASQASWSGGLLKLYVGTVSALGVVYSLIQDSAYNSILPSWGATRTYDAGQSTEYTTDGEAHFRLERNDDYYRSKPFSGYAHDYKSKTAGTQYRYILELEHEIVGYAQFGGGHGGTVQSGIRSGNCPTFISITEIAL